MVRKGGRVAGNEAGEVGRAASCWRVEAVVRDLNFNPRVMGGLRTTAGRPALPPPPFPFREF